MTEIRMDRTFAAAPEKVYRAWTDAATMSRWFCPNPDLALEVTADAVVGGRYRVDMGGGRYVAEGTYTALEPHSLVAFTWRWTTSDEPESAVRVELAPTDDGGTLLVLHHGALEDAESADGHREGWELSLARLAAAL